MSIVQSYDELLTNLLESDKNIKGVVVSLRNGLVVASKIRDIDTDEDIVAATTSVFDIFIKRVKKDFGSANNFINVMTVDQNKFLFAATGKDAILSIVASLEADDKKLKIYGGHVAKKVSDLIEHEPVDTTIPQVIHLLANARSSSFPNGNFIKKIIFLGDSQVGKSSIIKMYIEKIFDQKYIPTIGMNITEKSLKMNDDCHLDFKFWEMESQSHMFSPLRKRFYSDTSLAFIIFDLSRKITYENIQKWINILSKNFNEDVPFIILGNKADIPDSEVLQEDIEKLQKELKSLIFSVSAKNNDNIDEAFEFAAHKLFGII